MNVFPHDISKTDVARITKLVKEMFNDEFWKRIYFGVKISKVMIRVTKTLHAWVFAHLRVLAASRFENEERTDWLIDEYRQTDNVELMMQCRHLCRCSCHDSSLLSLLAEDS